MERHGSTDGSEDGSVVEIASLATDDCRTEPRAVSSLGYWTIVAHTPMLLCTKFHALGYAHVYTQV